MLPDDTPLTGRQVDLLGTWLPGARFVRDHSWGLVETTVYEVEHRGVRLVVKAGGPQDAHIAREIRAHLEWLSPWTSLGRAPELVHHDEDARLLVTRFLPGTLVQGHPSARDPETYRQAGELLAALHAQEAAVDEGYEPRENARTLGRLDGRHRIPAVQVAAVRAEVARWPHVSSVLVPTHGDWQPRNWLVHDGQVRAIDLGRADLRPAATDLTRLAGREFRRDPALEQAFVDGYGGDPREPSAWRRALLREAVGTAVWAYDVGDEGFEREGLLALAALLAG